MSSGIHWGPGGWVARGPVGFLAKVKHRDASTSQWSPRFPWGSGGCAAASGRFPWPGGVRRGMSLRFPDDLQKSAFRTSSSDTRPGTGVGEREGRWFRSAAVLLSTPSGTGGSSGSNAKLSESTRWKVPTTRSNAALERSNCCALIALATTDAPRPANACVASSASDRFVLIQASKSELGRPIGILLDAPPRRKRGGGERDRVGGPTGISWDSVEVRRAEAGLSNPESA
jgi:hypothetical protein